MFNTVTVNARGIKAPHPMLAVLNFTVFQRVGVVVVNNFFFLNVWWHDATLLFIFHIL
jgi:hypothetical protein